MKLQRDQPWIAEVHRTRHKIPKLRRNRKVLLLNIGYRHACTWPHDLPNTELREQTFILTTEGKNIMTEILTLTGMFPPYSER